MTTNTFTISNDMSDLCRVCLQIPEESQYLDLTNIYDEEDNLTYGECFTICTQIDLNDGVDVPHHLCKQCGLELQMCYDFLKKIENSKRLIEQCQRQKTKVKEKKSSKCNEHSTNLNSNFEEEELMNVKYEIVDDEQHIYEHSEETVEHCVIQQEDEHGFVEISNIDDETDAMDILNPCHTDSNTQRTQSNKNDSAIEPFNTKKVEEHSEMEDYQNLEALEDEETETLQIKCDENCSPIYIKKYEIPESEENEDVVEYVDDYNEEEVKENFRNERDVEYVQVINEEEEDMEEIEDDLRWQENVVAVANKEHLPILVESDGDTQVFKYKINKGQVVVNESSQDEAIANEGKVHETATKTKPNTGRKRHMGSYSCDYCHRVYPNYSRMKTHRRCHEINRPKFSCPHCGRVYATKQARHSHIQTAHDKSGYTCTICGKIFAIRKSLEIHVRYHTGDFPFACKLCDRKFAQACHLNTHINVKHNKIRFSCDYPDCGKTFTSSSSLRNHEFTHGVMPFVCEYCQQGYPAKSKLRVHIQRKHGIESSNDQLENMRKFHIMRSKVNLVQFVDTNKPVMLNKYDDFICNLPSFMLKEESIKGDSKAEEEIITNTTITPYIPTGMRLPIPPGPPFICELCGHSSKTKNLLASHRHRKHRLKESPYQCVKCDKSFNSKESYDKHKSRLSCHHYPQFTCEYCEKKIVGSANYKIHLRFHKKIYPFECQECGKGFMMAVHLTTHKETKHENKRYICEEVNCGKSFQSYQSLKSHTYVHLGCMPYCCEYCKKMFPNKGRLRWHIKTAHDFEVSFQDLDRMLVAQEITLKAKAKTV